MWQIWTIPNRIRLQGRLVLSRGISITLFNIFVVSFTRTQVLAFFHRMSRTSAWIRSDPLRIEIESKRTSDIREHVLFGIQNKSILIIFSNYFFKNRKMHFFFIFPRGAKNCYFVSFASFSYIKKDKMVQELVQLFNDVTKWDDALLRTYFVDLYIRPILS